MDDHAEETYPAQAQYLALRAAAAVLLQLAADVKEDEAARQIAGAEHLSDLAMGLVSQAVTYVAQELDLRAEQVYQANTRYIDLLMSRN
jgi:hypothetical protein